MFLSEPSHRTSDLDELTFWPEHLKNNFRRFTRFSADLISETKTVVSSAYCDNFISFGPILMPL